ncbi:MAG: arginase family protein [Pseudobdellovibrionaceae bacterium]|nr:arginase family protein [Bdellovibrionales bacterium]USN48454.1 MAG: arginase family protein [Pseudobdellovibrionaceae bacterium]
MSVLFVPFDGTSKKQISARSCILMYDLFKKQSLLSAKVVNLKGSNPGTFDQFFQALMGIEQPKVMVGGEHLLTYYSFLYFKSLLSPKKLKLVVFDAHHDAYTNQHLSHYSFIDWLVHMHEVEVLILGLRHEPEKMNKKVKYVACGENLDEVKSRIRDFIEANPFYLSVDVDVIDPTDFKFSAFPVEGGMSLGEFEALFEFCIALEPKFTDFVEFGIQHQDLCSKMVSRSIQWIERAYSK